MAQQWFLDLDGVRSGPYQTPEVLGLIAEGEILPHHRISGSLKDQGWITILEWRLEQAKLASPAEKKSYIPESSQTMATPAKKPTNEIMWTGPEATPANPRAAASEVAAVDLNAVASADEIEEVIQTLQENAPVTPTAAPVVAEPIQEPAAVNTSKLTLEPVSNLHLESPPADAPTTPKRKRDPMAEMFDMLQNTRQKREASAKASAHQQHSSPASERDHHLGSLRSPSKHNWMKTAMIGGLITVAGFMLGQLFQQSSTPPKVSTNEKDTGAPAAEAPAMKTVIEDRSTDKITIRAEVKKPLNGPANQPLVDRPMSAVTAPAPKLNEKEVQELKDLKQELQELKALKEELRNNNAGPSDGSDIPMDDNYLNGDDSGNADEAGGAAYAPETSEYPNAYPAHGKGIYPNPYGSPTQTQPPVNY